MKLLFALIAGFFFHYLLSCNNSGNTTATKCDSLAITKAILDNIQSSSFVNKPEYSYIMKILEAKSPIKYFSASSAHTPIDETKAREMHLKYLDNPLNIYWKDETTNVPYKVRGFNIPRRDLEILYDKGKKGARIYLGLDPASGEYSFILTAVNDKYGNHLANQEIFDDFFPCPTQCPQDGGLDGTAKKSDLNYWFNPQRQRFEFKPIQ